MMNVSSLELSKELYELSEWTHFPDVNDLFYVVSHENELDNYVATWHELKEAPETYWLTSYKLPAYDLGYLLRKLEACHETIILRYNNPESMDSLALSDWNKRYTAATVSMTQGSYPIADTPEDAACKLAIELFKQKILTPNTEGKQ